MGKRFAFYFLLMPISYLPLWVLYLISDFFYLLLRTIIPYRRKVVRANLQACFPEKSEQERRIIERLFYRYLTDLLAESIKNLSISKRNLERRISIKNPELLEKYFAENRDVLLFGGHFNNWEWLITHLNPRFSHQAVGIGKTMTDGFWDQAINKRRSRFGMIVVNAKNFKAKLQELKDTPISILVLSDQSPGSSTKSYWTPFLNRNTPVLFGGELMANQQNMCAVYLHMYREKRGHYSIEFKELTDNPRALEYGELTKMHVQELEKAIQKQPHRWLWSHKRWKREFPENYDEISKENEAKFHEKRFG